MKSLLLSFTILIFSVSAFADDFVASAIATRTAMDNLKLTGTSRAEAVIEKITPMGASDRVHVRLTYPGMPALRLFLSGPAGFLQRQDRSLPALFMVAGFFTGAYNTLLLGEVPGTVVVSFDYPYTFDEITRDPAKLLQTFRLTPGAIALGLKWLSEQSWHKADQSMALGVSLGGLFLPSALKMAQEMNAAPPRTIFAFTGADLRETLGNLLKGQVPASIAEIFVFALPAVNVLSDPKIHLSSLRGKFLVIFADQDQIIPRSSSEALLNSLPSPKSAVLLPGGHINYDQQLQIDRTKEAILEWLKN